MTRKNEMTPAELTENIFDVIAHTSFADQAGAEMWGFLEDKNIEVDRDTGHILITDWDTDQELFKITITKL